MEIWGCGGSLAKGLGVCRPGGDTGLGQRSPAMSLCGGRFPAGFKAPCHRAARPSSPTQRGTPRLSGRDGESPPLGATKGSELSLSFSVAFVTVTGLGSGSALEPPAAVSSAGLWGFLRGVGATGSRSPSRSLSLQATHGSATPQWQRALCRGEVAGTCRWLKAPPGDFLQGEAALGVVRLVPIAGLCPPGGRRAACQNRVPLGRAPRCCREGRGGLGWGHGADSRVSTPQHGWWGTPPDPRPGEGAAGAGTWGGGHGGGGQHSRHGCSLQLLRSPLNGR